MNKNKGTSKLVEGYLLYKKFLQNKLKIRKVLISMTEKRITKKEKFEMVKELVLASEVDNKDLLVEFIDKEVENLTKKVGAKTKTQKENEVLVEKVYDELAKLGKAITVTEFLKEVEIEGVATNQKASALLKKLVDTGRVKKVIEKKVSYFEVA